MRAHEHATLTTLRSDLQDARDAAERAGLPADWLLFNRVEHGAEGMLYRWTASRGYKARWWSYLPLVLGLRSTVIGATIEELRREVARQEWLLAVYALAIALNAATLRAHRPEGDRTT